MSIIFTFEYIKVLPPPLGIENVCSKGEKKEEKTPHSAPLDERTYHMKCTNKDTGGISQYL